MNRHDNFYTKYGEVTHVDILKVLFLKSVLHHSLIVITEKTELDVPRTAGSRF